jgi:hypothetical protein
MRWARRDALLPTLRRRCLYDDVASVSRNDFERANISAIKEVESSKGC